MSTHEPRKDAAALFEVVEKSTLKLPKSTPAVEVPSWWSSKTNPPAAANATVGERLPTQGIHTPPPMADKPAATPPGAASVTRFARPAEPAPVAAPGAPSTPAPRLHVKPKTYERLARGGDEHYNPASSSSHASAMVNRPDFIKRLMPGAPMWAVYVMAGAAVVVPIVLIALAMMIGKYATRPATTQPMIQPDYQNTRNNNVPPPPVVNNNTVTNPPVVNNNTTVTNPPVQPGKVYTGAQIQRDPNLNYLVIASVATQEQGQTLGEFIAQRGVSVAVEKSNTRNLYYVASVDGFANKSSAEARDFKQRVVNIGIEHPEYRRRGRNPWGDAYFTYLRRGN